MECLQKIEDGEIDRLLGLMPPGSGKSIFSSVVFPTHYLGRFPGRSLIVASYGSDLPKKFGRRARSIVRQTQYRRIFDTTLSEESGAVDEWALTNGSEWIAAGILTGITGNRVDGVVWDDLIKGREQADSDIVRQKTWDAYIEDLLTRKKPRTGFEIGISCLAGETQITMGDGTRKSIREIKSGDSVASFSNGKIIINRVTKWKNQGPDKVYQIHTGGSKIKANARHPLLVARTFHKELGSNAKRQVFWPYCGDERLEWVRVKDLKVGDKLVTNSKIYGQERGSLDVDQAWLLGYMFGDGWITVRDSIQKGRGCYTTRTGEKRIYKENTYPRRGYVTCVAVSNDEDENRKVFDLFQKIFNVNLKRTRFNQQITGVAHVGRWFIQHGLTGKAKTKRLPAFIFSEPGNIRLALLTGFANADGHRNKKGDWSLSSCNTELLEDFKQLARGLGFRVRNVHSRQSWMQAPNSPKPTFSTSACLNFGGERVESEFILRGILDIRECCVEDVFDIEVDGSECFFADGIVSHNTRWHEDDPAGRILPVDYNGESGWVNGQDGNKWYVVCLPAVCERQDDLLGRQVGEILWPEWFTEEHFAPFKRQPRTWSALFQQRPAPDTGDFFKVEWLKPYTKMPPLDTLKRYGASDYAVTADGGDYTVHIVVGIDPHHHVYLLDLWRAQTSSDQWIETFCNMVARWRPLGWAEEKGQIKAGVGPFLEKRLRERKLYIARADFPTRTDKEIRAQSIRGRMAMDGLYVPAHMPWYPEFRRELLSFPAGRNDDQVDALGLIGQVLDKMVSGSPLPPDPEKPKILSTNPEDCTVTLDDLWEANESRSKYRSVRIH